MALGEASRNGGRVTGLVITVLAFVGLIVWACGHLFEGLDGTGDRDA